LFSPDPSKTFNRGYTRYFLSGGGEKMASMDTPKSIGEPVGSVVSLERGFFRTDCSNLQNGDGLCFFARNGTLTGFRVERIENGSIIPSSMKGLAKGVQLYRNHSIALTRQLQKVSGQRRIAVEITYIHDGDTVRLEAEDEDGNRAEWTRMVAYEEPTDRSMAREVVAKQLTSTGNTPFRITRLGIGDRIGFLPVSVLNGCRRQILEELLKVRDKNYLRESRPLIQNEVPYPDRKLDFHANVFNAHARRFYSRHGSEVIEPAFEALPEVTGREVMRTRYCLRHELDACLKRKGARHFKEPLQIMDGHHAYLLKFDCDACRMSLIFLGKR
jgi:putative protease